MPRRRRCSSTAFTSAMANAVSCPIRGHGRRGRAAAGRPDRLGGPHDGRADGPLGDGAEGDHADAGLDAVEPKWHGQARGARLQLPARHVPALGSPAPRPEDGPARRAPGEGVAAAGAVGDVDAGGRRLDHDDRDAVVALRHREVRRRPDRVGQHAQMGFGGRAERRHHPARQAGQSETGAVAPGVVDHRQPVVLQRGQEAVDDGSRDAEGLGQVGDAQRVVGRRQELEQLQAAIEGLGRLPGHQLTTPLMAP